jgi:hypothetical protein
VLVVSNPNPPLIFKKEKVDLSTTAGGSGGSEGVAKKIGIIARVAILKNQVIALDYLQYNLRGER